MRIWALFMLVFVVIRVLRVLLLFAGDKYNGQWERENAAFALVFYVIVLLWGAIVLF